MQRFPFFRSKRFKKFKMKEEEGYNFDNPTIRDVVNAPVCIEKGLNWLMVPNAAMIVVSMFSDYLSSAYYYSNALLCFWSTTCSVFITGAAAGYQTIKYYPGSYKLPCFIAPAIGFLGAYAGLNESWEAYCFQTMSNILYYIYFSRSSMISHLPEWVTKAFTMFYIGTTVTSFYIIYALIRKEWYLTGMEYMTNKIKNDKYVATEYLKL
jgi:hypothetical protein